MVRKCMMLSICLQDQEPITVVLDDGFNVVQYAFKLQSLGAKQTLVKCQVGALMCSAHHQDLF